VFRVRFRALYKRLKQTFITMEGLVYKTMFI